MRTLPALVIAAAVTAAVVTPTTSAFAVCHTTDTCNTIYTPLRVAIVSLVPSALQTSMITKTVTSQRLAPTDPCRAVRPLFALSHQVEGLAAGNVIDLGTSVTLTSEIESLVGLLQPGDPC